MSFVTSYSCLFLSIPPRCYEAITATMSCILSDVPDRLFAWQGSNGATHRLCPRCRLHTHSTPRLSLYDVIITVALMVMGTLHYGMWGHEHTPYIWPFADPETLTNIAARRLGRSPLSLRSLGDESPLHAASQARFVACSNSTTFCSVPP